VRQTQQRIAHGSADAPGLEPRVLQCASDFDDLPRWAKRRRRSGGYPQSTLPPFTFRISPVT
jgi:hypothetical protein